MNIANDIETGEARRRVYDVEAQSMNVNHIVIISVSVKRSM